MGIQTSVIRVKITIDFLSLDIYYIDRLSLGGSEMSAGVKEGEGKHH